MLVRTGVIVTFLIICAQVAYTDIRKQKIYNEAVAALFVPAIVSFFAFPEISMVSRVLGAVSVSGLMLLVCLIMPGAFGGGDVKLMVPIGLFLGLEKVLTAGILAVFAGGIWSVAMILHAVHKNGRIAQGNRILWKKEYRKKRISFGPALCLGATLALLL